MFKTKKILVIGSGGREHALAYKIAQSPHVELICAPGNAGMAQVARCVPIPSDDIPRLLAFAKEEKIDLTVVGPEAPLVAGIVDIFQKEGLKVFGPSAKAAQLEASKAFSKEIMRKYNVPAAASVTCSTMEEATQAIERFSVPVVIKADGLAAGKGVVICETRPQALEAARRMLVERIFGDSGAIIVVEEFLEGEEASILVLTNGQEVIALESSQDHKRAFDEDRGPNTGGMGAYSPAPVVTPEFLKRVMKEIVLPVIKGMSREGAEYRGILYAGVMATKTGPKVLEFNVRFGDPETQAVLLRLKSDLVEAMLWTIEPKARKPALKWDKRPSVCVVVASGGYPDLYEKRKVIAGLEEASALEDVVVFHAGTERLGIEYITTGGRVLGVTAQGPDIKSAIEKAYQAIALVHFDKMHYRRDIGWRALMGLRRERTI